MNLRVLFITVCSIFVLSGCVPKDVEPEFDMDETIHTYNLSDTAIEIAKDLSFHLKKRGIYAGNISVTTFVELSDFKKTSKFGRLLSESLYHELYSRGVKLLDFRIKRGISIDSKGEYYLSRDFKALNKLVKTRHVLVGTYSYMDKGLFINARVVDTHTGRVLTTSRVIYHTSKYCKIFGKCKRANNFIKLMPAR